MKVCLLALFVIFCNLSIATPSLIEEKTSLEEYVNQFPFESYQIVEVKGQGKFYIDRRDDSIKGTLARGEVWEEYILGLIKCFVRPGTIALDIGAHIGTHAISMSKLVGDQGKVWAFEPQKKIYRELVMNARLNQCANMVIKRFALGDEHKLVTMNPASPGNEGGTPIGSGGDLVEMRPLDSFNLQNVSFIKMDVEQSENAVLDGGRRTILQNRPVIILEIMGGYDWDFAPEAIRQHILKTIEKVKALKYHVTRIGGADYLAVPYQP